MAAGHVSENDLFLPLTSTHRDPQKQQNERS